MSAILYPAEIHAELHLDPPMTSQHILTSKLEELDSHLAHAAIRESIVDETAHLSSSSELDQLFSDVRALLLELASSTPLESALVLKSLQSEWSQCYDVRLCLIATRVG